MDQRTTPVTPKAPLRSGLYHVLPDDTVDCIFGTPLDGDALDVIRGMIGTAEGGEANRPGVRKSGTDFLVRIPLAEGSAIWRMPASSGMDAAAIHTLATEAKTLIGSRTTDAAQSNDLAKSKDTQDAPWMGRLLERLATIPRNSRAATQRRVLTAISDVTGWQHVSALRMRDGQVKSVREALAYASEKPPSIRILANRVAALDPAQAAFKRTDDTVANDPESLTYMDQYSVEGFAISLPDDDGIGLYAEGSVDPAELTLARNAFALWAKRRDTTNRRWTTRITLAAAAVALAIFLGSPIPTDIGAPAEVEPAQSEIVVLGYEARLIGIDVRTGDAVSEGDVLARFTSTELVEAEKRATLDQMLETLGAQEALASEDYAEFQLAEQKKSIAVFRADQSRRRLDSLTLRAPSDGRVASIVQERNIGTQLPEGAPVAEIQIGDQMRARLNVSSADAPRIAPGQTGEILVRGALNTSYPITVIDRPVLSEDPQTGIAGHSVMVRIDGDASALQKGLTGYARLSGEIRPRIMVWLTPVLEYVRFTAWKYLGSQF